MRIIFVLAALLVLAGCETYSATVTPVNTRAHITVGVHSGYHYRPYLYEPYYYQRPVVIHKHVHPRPVYVYKHKHRKYHREDRRHRYDHRRDHRREDRRERRRHD